MMRTFVWTIVVLTAFEIPLMAWALATDQMQREPKFVAVAIFLNSLLLAWGVYVLAV
jgi:hypothetical protein